MLEKLKHVFLVLGVMLCMNASVDHELVKLVSEHVTRLSADVHKMQFKNQEDMDKLGLQLKNIEQHLQTRIEKLERAQDVLQQEQMSTAFKVDELKTSQNLLQLHQSSLSANVDVVQHEIDVLHQEQSSTAVKVDNLATNQDVLQHEMDTLHQEQSSTTVKLDNLATNQDVLQHEMDTLHQELESNQLQSSHKASLQRVMHLESQKKYCVPVTISYGKYKLIAYECISYFPVENKLLYCVSY